MLTIFIFFVIISIIVYAFGKGDYLDFFKRKKVITP
ncbi:uncharacterized protein METZ01_LOCUS440620, partial [marine metagenome]